MASLAAQSPTDSGPSPLLSNNPFRNRNGLPSPALPSPTTNGRPISRNPFLDTTDMALQAHASTTIAPQPVKPAFGDNTTELLENLSISEQPKRRPPPPPPTQSKGASTRPENIPPGSRVLPPQSDEQRQQHAGKPRAPRGELNIFADASHDPRPRRNSDTSVQEKSTKSLDPNDDRRRRERRHRDSRKDGKPRGPTRRLDIIDKLDVTSIYGTGLFHHDGPFDACNPHRNQKGSRSAPMQAFPKDSRNMALGGSGPNNSNIDLAQFHGQGEEGYNDYSTSAVVDEYGDSVKRPDVATRSASFHPITRVEPLHGEESMGLGTSTFLEGAPASKAALSRRETDSDEVPSAAGGGLGRKKSLAMKIRGISNPRTVAGGGGGRTTPPELGEKRLRTPTSPLRSSQSVQDNNPFFKDYDREYEKKGAQITFAEKRTSPKQGAFGLERKNTIESVGEEPKTSGGGGFLSRVRSLKGGPRKARGERREAS